jgi:hypothetical protein
MTEINDDSPSVIGGGLPTMPTPEEAWRAKFAARLVEVANMPEHIAIDYAQSAELDLTEDPSDAADMEMSYWDE